MAGRKAIPDNMKVKCHSIYLYEHEVQAFEEFKKELHRNRFDKYVKVEIEAVGY